MDMNALTNTMLERKERSNDSCETLSLRTVGFGHFGGSHIALAGGLVCGPCLQLAMPLFAEHMYSALVLCRMPPLSLLSVLLFRCYKVTVVVKQDVISVGSEGFCEISWSPVRTSLFTCDVDLGVCGSGTFDGIAIGVSPFCSSIG